MSGRAFEKRAGWLDEAMEYYQRSYQPIPLTRGLEQHWGGVGQERRSHGVVWQLLALQPDYPSALFNMGNALAKQGN